ncbi:MULTISPECIES: helix-turn-helix domain-containing protein [unclassified Rhizobium]|uniref:helix-turn-helix domain-containing protein n=1 Tax=unclassified Rhizobium TaxID=2613769 RepID=UPI0007136B25|nr:MULTISPECIES: helix-turn-helix transcriptional regulator [unclassified Rhizobium]KQS99173.1 XRE family transcriptional regulator [Rhizobium sp. Leaf386]KQT05353.1 XRE family transcriptional regulator [Rhizobium sp. Leaf391]KQT91795.1 XRE family transcriptional regulator [Rhizobium sp. Leaf453]
MNTPVSFTTPNGEEMVVLSRSDYNLLLQQSELVEDLEDLLAVKAYEARVAAGEEERVPVEFVDRLIDGEHPVRVWRDFRGLSAKDLAAAAGISTAYISEIETGKKEGSISVLKAIARVLRLDLDDVVPTRDEAPSKDD